MRDKSQDITRQFQLLNQMLRDEAACLREDLALQKLETALALMQLANTHNRASRETALHAVN